MRFHPHDIVVVSESTISFPTTGEVVEVGNNTVTVRFTAPAGDVSVVATFEHGCGEYWFDISGSDYQMPVSIELAKEEKS